MLWSRVEEHDVCSVYDVWSEYLGCVCDVLCVVCVMVCGIYDIQSE